MNMNETVTDPSKNKNIEQKFYLSLEEIYNGHSKNMSVTQKLTNADQKTTKNETKTLIIACKPGLKTGTDIKFANEYGNMHFILCEKPHKRFTRNENNLIYKHRLSLKQALLGCTVQLCTLDGRILRIPINRVIYPGYAHTVPNEGMPIPDGKIKGNLIIEFDIVFPASLSENQKKQIDQIL